MREDMAKYFTDIPCAACAGHRLKPEALCVKIAGLHIGEVAEMSIKRAGEWFTELPRQLTPKQNEIAGRVLKEIRERLKFLVDVGLEYLTLGARVRHTLRRREPAHPARLADRLGAHRRALRAGRAFDRAASARQRAAARDAQAPARPRQHGAGGRARRGCDPHRRSCGRRRPRRRDPRRRDRRAGQRRGSHGHAGVDHRQISLGRARGSDSGAAAREHATHPAGDRCARQQSQERHRRDPARSLHLRHRRLRRRQVHAC